MIEPSNNSEKKLPLAERVPKGVIALATECNGDIDEFLVQVDFEFPELPITREDARSIVRYAVLEREADELATAPSGTDYLLSQADKILKAELDRLAKEQRVLQVIADSPPNKDYRIKETGMVLSPAEARSRMAEVIDRILEIKKSLAEDVKAQAKNEGGGFNMQLNFGDVLTEAIGNIKSMGDEDIPVRRVESVASRPAGEN